MLKIVIILCAGLLTLYLSCSINVYSRILPLNVLSKREIQLTYRDLAPKFNYISLTVFVINYLIFIILLERYGISDILLANYIFVLGLTLITLMDLRYQIIADSVTLPLLWLGIVVALLGMLTISLEQSVTGAIVGYISVNLIRIMSRDGIGQGDAKLMACLGAWFGYHTVIAILVLSSMLASIYILLMRKKGKIALGPFITIPVLLIIILGLDIENILQVYIKCLSCFLDLC